MERSVEPSSSISFTSSSHMSNGCTTSHIAPVSSASETGSSLEVISLSKLSASLEQLLVSDDSDFSDADIIVEGIPVGIHRCILASRSNFFYELFKRDHGSIDKEGKPKYLMSDLLPFGKIGYDVFLIFLGYLYTGKLKPPPLDVSTCVDHVCAHDACGPVINISVELIYAASIFQVPELVSLFQRRLLNFVGKALIEDVIPILVAASHCELGQLFDQCIDRVSQSDINNLSLEKELPFEVAENIKVLRLKSKATDEHSNNNKTFMDPMHEKRLRRIHKALDSDDVELVKLLLSESNITLDEANALHYAAAYCDPKVVSEVLNLGLADVNLRNAQGYTVLHIAAMRREPSIIVSLLTKGACASDITTDGQSAVSICRRLTRPKDYHVKTEQGQVANKDRVCIDVLDREILRNSMAGNVPFLSSPTMSDDLHMKLLYLENRVAFARLLFPLEAKLAMEIANAQTGFEFTGLSSSSKGSSGNLREVDLNETPIMQKKRLHSRVETLLKTVETGRRYFPHCSEVLDKFMEDDLPDLFYLEKGTPEEQKIKRRRFTELKNDVQKAFSKDKAESHLSGLTSVSSSSSQKDIVHHKIRKL